MKPLIILILALLFSSYCVNGQELNLRTFNYSKADSIALHFPKTRYKSYTELVAPLTDKLKTEQEKFRVIFRWIADNVAYSISNSSDDPDKVVKKKKAVCIGYSTLLKDMCNSIGIECEVITGWSKVDPVEIGQKTKETTHAWNAVKLNGNWYLTDVTWATSAFNKKKKKFYKEFDTAYFLPTPAFFIKQHFPKDKKWQMLDTLVKKSFFIKSLVWYEAANQLGTWIISPTKGKVTQKGNKDFTVVLHITKWDSTSNLDFIIDDDINKTQISEVKSYTNNRCMTVKCNFPENLKGEHNVDVYYNGQAINGFRIDFY
ncbi:MAG TPA: transglutaminase domain-containing protein [Bacteroidia bacterium]|jgi:transglutaminase/protease-like cytokinesis protein 3|nr:transglutaminase domain-containing protein [Bacteroidia bacterium]